jgi:cellulase/cellobiase CelA1
MTGSTSHLALSAAAPVVEYSFKSRWDTGYVVLIRVTNTSTATWYGWSLSLQLGDGSVITSYWNTRLSGTSGAVRAADDDWNAVVAPGQQADFGMEGTRSFRPSGCAINGQACRFQYSESSAHGHGRAR